MARILIVDDHEVVREGLKMLLANLRPEWSICGEAANGADAVSKTQELRPDIVLLDISMAGMSGLEACSRMRKLALQTPVLIFTTHDSKQLSEDVREAGAQGFVLKTQAVRDLVRAMDTVLAGGTFFGNPEAGQRKIESERQSGGSSLCVGLRMQLAWV